jgi:hypothetical protein
VDTDVSDKTAASILRVEMYMVRKWLSHIAKFHGGWSFKPMSDEHNTFPLKLMFTYLPFPLV